MRIVVLAAAAFVATGLVACGGDDDKTAEPLTLEQRTLRGSEVPGSKPDPVETRLTAGSLDEFAAWRERHVLAAEIDRTKLEDAGFVSAIQDTRFFPKTPGGAHTRDAPHVRMLVLQFESDDGAQTAADLLYENGLKPCPGRCAMRIEEIEVSDTPDARGLRHSATAERIKALGEHGEPFDAYLIVFADGRFAYVLDLFGPPGTVSKEQIEELAETVHDRVEGAPPAAT